jgi:thioredoxin reductase
MALNPFAVDARRQEKTMALPARNSLAVIGAGPVGLEAASAALGHGFDVHVLERGAVGASVLGWGHVSLFTPWRMNLGPSSAERLLRSGWKAPENESRPTGADLVEQYLRPLAALPEFNGRVHTNAQVVWIGRRGLLKGDLIGESRRRDYPFRLLVRDSGGRESLLHAFAVIDASGVYGQPNWAGDGGIPARGELYLAPQMSYHLDDVLDLRRRRYAGKRVLVVGGGASAATVVIDLAKLASQAAGTSVLWATRRAAHELFQPIARDPLAGRESLHQQARELLTGSNPAIQHAGGVVIDSFEFNSAKHTYRVTLREAGLPGSAEATRVEEVDQVLINTGFGPDNSLYRELQVHECYASRGPMNLSAALLGAGATDCLTTPKFGADVLAHPEPDFFILGHKSYGRSPNFLLETGYQQIKEVIEKLAEQLVLDNTVG